MKMTQLNEDKKAISKKISFDEFEDFFFTSDKKNLYKFILQTVEKPLIEMVLKKTRGNKIKAAQLLGINRNTLHSKIKKLNIKISEFKRR